MPQADLQIGSNSNEHVARDEQQPPSSANNSSTTRESGDALTQLQENLPTGYVFSHFFFKSI